MRHRNSDLNEHDWELCCRYIEEMQRQGLAAHEPWELGLKPWTLSKKLHDHKVAPAFPSESLIRLACITPDEFPHPEEKSSPYCLMRSSPAEA